MPTKAIFLEDTFVPATLAVILEIGTDEHGHYFTPDRTIVYPQGGGQPGDFAWVEHGNVQLSNITRARWFEEAIRHYTPVPLPSTMIGTEVALHISRDTRVLHAAYHTGGHWVTQAICEGLQLPLNPVKGHHFPGEAYIEFTGDTASLTNEHIDDIRMVLMVDLQAGYEVLTKNKADAADLAKAFIPANFNLQPGKHLRLVTIGDYRPVPCGGTHVGSIRGIRSVAPLKVYTKGGKIRVTYTCTVHDTWAS